MSLAASINRHNTGSGLNAVLIQLDLEGREDLMTAISSSEVSHTAIVRGLRDHGIDVSEASVRRWRDRMRMVDGL